MKWSAYQAFFLVAFFFYSLSFLLSCLLACSLACMRKLFRKKKEIHKWGGAGLPSFWFQHSYDHDHDAFNITCGPHFTSPHLTSPFPPAEPESEENRTRNCWMTVGTLVQVPELLVLRTVQ